MCAWKMACLVNAKYIRKVITIDINSKLFFLAPKRKLEQMTVHGVVSYKPDPAPQ